MLYRLHTHTHTKNSVLTSSFQAYNMMALIMFSYTLLPSKASIIPGYHGRWRHSCGLRNNYWRIFQNLMNKMTSLPCRHLLKYRSLSHSYSALLILTIASCSRALFLIYTLTLCGTAYLLIRNFCNLLDVVKPIVMCDLYLNRRSWNTKESPTHPYYTVWLHVSWCSIWFIFNSLVLLCMDSCSNVGFDLHSFIILSKDRSQASSKTIPPHSAI